MKLVKKRKLTSSIWTYFLILGIVYYVYQSSFGWSQVNGRQAIDAEKVVFLTVQEQRYGVQKAGFSSLYKSLEIWKYDSKNKEVDLKFEANLPRSKTKVMFIYDRGYDSFQRFAQVTPIASFPYLYKYDNKALITVEGYNENGTLYLNYKGKKVELKSGKNYYAWSIQDRTLVKTSLTNQGLFSKDQFVQKEPQ